VACVCESLHCVRGLLWSLRPRHPTAPRRSPSAPTVARGLHCSAPLAPTSSPCAVTASGYVRAVVGMCVSMSGLAHALGVAIRKSVSRCEWAGLAVYMAVACLRGWVHDSMPLRANIPAPMSCPCSSPWPPSRPRQTQRRWPACAVPAWPLTWATPTRHSIPCLATLGTLPVQVWCTLAWVGAWASRAPAVLSLPLFQAASWRLQCLHLLQQPPVEAGPLAPLACP
jgi:hypothetical protein